MTYVLLVVATLAFAELFVRLPILQAVGRASDYARRSARLIQAPRISDHWKEKALPIYSARILGQTLRLCVYLIIVFLPVAVALVIAQQIHVPLWAALISPIGIGASILVAAAYLFVRGRIVGR